MITFLVATPGWSCIPAGEVHWQCCQCLAEQHVEPLPAAAHVAQLVAAAAKLAAGFVAPDSTHLPKPVAAEAALDELVQKLLLQL